MDDNKQNKARSIVAIILCFIAGCAYTSYDVNFTPLSKTYISNNDTTSLIHFLPAYSSAEIELQEELWYFWLDDEMQVHYTKGNYGGKLLYGEFLISYPDKNLYKKGNFKNGLKDGVWQVFYPNGQVKIKSEWNEGMQIGTMSKFTEQGSLISKTLYKNGLKHGTEVMYSDSVRTIRKFKYGKLKWTKTNEN